ncbi:MAG: glycerol-3-phosphate 1-O-acyltransferase PlsY [Dehalococcoidia bacterium]|nr:glycerol-3-phosphate 1-O-acyltransferase PlsY [Dehalococcoidia bacterium]
MSDFAINVALGYLFGSIPFGLVVGFLFTGRDIRQFGSGKTGTTNVLRTAGRFAAILVMVGDISKGVVPALVGRYFFDDNWVAAAGAAAGVVGHIFPIFAGFRGGRGVAVAFGGVLGLAPLWALALPLIGAAILIPTRYVSLMSVLGTAIAALILCIAALLWDVPIAFAIYALFATLIIEYMHIPNIKRLLAGTEPRLGQGGDRAATG